MRLVIFGIADFLALAMAAGITALLTNEPEATLMFEHRGMRLPLSEAIYAMLAICWVLLLGLVTQSYTRRQTTWQELREMLETLLLFGLTYIILLTISGANLSFKESICILAMQCFLIPGARRVSRKMAGVFNCWLTPTLIFGTGNNALQAYHAIQSDANMGFDVKAFVELNTDNNEVLNQKSPVSGIACINWPLDLNEFKALSAFHNVIAMESKNQEQSDSLIRQLTCHEIKDVHVIPTMRGVPLHGLQAAHFFSHEVLMIQLRNNSAKPLHRLYKRSFDLFGASILLILLSPLFLLLAYRISRDGAQPFFGHTRIGRKGKSFNCYKFRSMVPDASTILKNILDSDPVAQAEWAKDFKLKNDPRVTKLGSFLRRTSMDELPQLWNVVLGDMSLVGPRPVVQAELERYGIGVDYYLLAKPGMTGLWQVSGRSDIDYAERIYLDAWYIRNWSLWTDIAILFKTISVVINRSGAY